MIQFKDDCEAADPKDGPDRSQSEGRRGRRRLERRRGLETRDGQTDQQGQEKVERRVAAKKTIEEEEESVG